MATPKSLLKAVAQWREATLQTLDARFGEALDTAIPALLDRSEKARNNSLQSAYFQAQQALRRNRAELQESFKAALIKRLDNDPAALSDKPAESPGELRLINPDTFERLVVLQTLGDRADQQYYTLLHELGHRLSVLHSGSVVRPSHIPASPTQLLNSFDDATLALEIEHVAWQALAAVFDKVLLRTLQADYKTLNDTLRDAGVLPNLKLQAVQSPPTRTKRTPEPVETANAEDSASSDDGMADMLQIRNLLASHGLHAAAVDRGPMEQGQITELFSEQNEYLSQLLPEHGLFSPGQDGLQIGQQQLDDSLEAMSQQRDALKAAIGEGNLSHYDETTIDIIGALFEAMLDEADLPAPIKALLSHLHTPYLKLAMHEPELLSNLGHPARQLLDELVRAGESWGDCVDLGKGIFPTLKDIVEVLRDGATPDRKTLEGMRAQLLRQVGELRRRRDLRSERVTEAEAGRAKLDQAKVIAETHIQRLLAAEKPSQPGQIFLTGPWQDYLTLLLLRNRGKPGSKDWLTSEALGTEVARLSRAVTRNSPPPAKALKELSKQLTRTLGELAPHYQGQIDELIRTLHTLREQSPAQIAQEQKVVPLRPRQPLHKAEILDPPLNQTEQGMLAELRTLAPGTSFRIHSSDGQPTRLLTVTWFNPNTDRLFFVDQYGAKADLITVQRMARLIHEEKAHNVADDKRESFVSRALKNLRNYLEQSALFTPGSSHD